MSFTAGKSLLLNSSLVASSSLVDFMRPPSNCLRASAQVLPIPYIKPPSIHGVISFNYNEAIQNLTTGALKFWVPFCEFGNGKHESYACNLVATLCSSSHLFSGAVRTVASLPHIISGSEQGDKGFVTVVWVEMMVLRNRDIEKLWRASWSLCI